MPMQFLVTVTARPLLVHTDTESICSSWRSMWWTWNGKWWVHVDAIVLSVAAVSVVDRCYSVFLTRASRSRSLKVVFFCKICRNH